MPTTWHCHVTPPLRDYNHPIMIMSVNMHKRNAVTHVLLNSDRFTNIFLIQEPWYDTISTTRKDTSLSRHRCLGGCYLPWLGGPIPKSLRRPETKSDGLCLQVGHQYTTQATFHPHPMPRHCSSPLHTGFVTGRLARGQENRWAGGMSAFDPQDW